MRAFLARLWLATVCFFRILFAPPFAARVAAAARGPATSLPPVQDRSTPPAGPSAISAAQLARNEQALQLLSMLQREGGLIDFCEQDLAGLSDAQIGATARAVHDGCRRVLRNAFELLPVRSEQKGGAVMLPAGFDPRSIRLTGSLGNPPFAGVLRHHGWRVSEIRMPPAAADPTILAPAEVELP